MKLNKRLTRLGALLLAVSLLVTLAACTGGKEPETPDRDDTGTIQVVNRVGKPIQDAQVYTYADNTLTDLIAFGKTDSEGNVSMLFDPGNVAVIKGVAPGYKLEECYPLDSYGPTIVLDALAAPSDEVTDVKYELGDPVMDFTFTDVDGNTYVASEVLAEKKMLMLNFFFTTCGPCAAEFPYLQAAYDQYKDKAALLAVDPYEVDDADSIKAFRDSHKLTIPMVDADSVWASRLNITAYPTTVVIDRFGYLTFYHIGSVTDSAMFETLFAYYGAENYVHKATDDVTELVIPDEPADPTDPDGTTVSGVPTVPTAPDTSATDAEQGSKDSPIEIGGTLTFKAEVPAGKSLYYNVYKVSGTVLTIKAEDIAVQYNGDTYRPENGVISFPVKTDDVTIPIKLAITNKGKETNAFNVTFAYPAGTIDNPHALKLGNITTQVAKGDDDGVVYEYKVPKAGVIEMYVTSAPKGVDYDLILYNLTSYAYYNLSQDGAKSGSKKTVSISVSKGDVLRVTVATLPNEKNEYPAATIKSHIDYKAGAKPTTKPTIAKMDYKVTVKGDGKALSGVKLTFTVGKDTKTVKTNSKGVAVANLPAGECTVRLTCPKGYIAEKLQYTVDSAKPTLTIQLEKEELPPQDEPGDIPTDYSVKVVDGSGKGQKGITVALYSGSKKAGSAKTDSKGVAKLTLMDGTYTVKLSGTTLKYDEKTAVVSVAKPSAEIVLAKEQGTKKEKITCPVLNKSRAAYVVNEGATYVTLKPGERNYFLFTPSKDGVYRITTTSNYAKVGYYGGSIHYIQTANLAENLENNAFTVEVKDVGPTFVLGVDAATNMEATVLLVTRVGDPGWSIADEPWQTYQGTHTPKNYTLPDGTKLTNMDITKTYKLVYNSTDGYYHKDTKNGPVVYLRFDSKAPYVSFADILNSFHVAAYLYDGAGKFQKKEEYTECMTAYNDCTDKDEGVYPLTKDLEYIVKQYGKHQGWWNPESPGYLFKDADGNPLPNVNLDSAWMFALCYASK